MRLYFVRHAHTPDTRVRLSGRIGNVDLSPQGTQQVKHLSRWFRARTLNQALCSPQRRCLQTAQAILHGRSTPLQVSESWDEIDFGAWSGKTWAELDGSAQWHRFNNIRSQTHAPGGEGVLDVQRRAVRDLCARFQSHASASVLIVTHGDVIRSVLIHYLGIPIDHMLRIEVDPASVTELELTEHGCTVKALNLTEHLRA